MSQPGILSQSLRNVERATQGHRWHVSDAVWFTTFSFESLVIYQELNALVDMAVNHSVVAALARAAEIGEMLELTTEELDELVAPDVVPVPILPVDSSQLHALADSAAGNHHLCMVGEFQSYAQAAVAAAVALKDT